MDGPFDELQHAIKLTMLHGRNYYKSTRYNFTLGETLGWKKVMVMASSRDCRSA